MIRLSRPYELLAMLLSSLLLSSATAGAAQGESQVAPPERPQQFSAPGPQARLAEASALIHAAQARTEFGVDGKDLTVAIIDSGIWASHADFSGRIVAQRNFSPNYGGDPENAADGHGHGTHVAGIIAARGDHLGIAPGVLLLPLKALDNEGSAAFGTITAALQWVLDNRERHKISAVNLSLGDGGNYTLRSSDGLQLILRGLRQARIPVVAAAGNSYYTWGSRPGMSYPAIFPETISVGAVYSRDMGLFNYLSGAKAKSSGADRLAPFSQRLHPDLSAQNRTDLFAPGAPILSTGILNDHGEALLQGTSQATPMVTGVVLLMQELHLRKRGILPTVDDLETWLRAGATTIRDGDDEDDNVKHSGLDFLRLDALGALRAMGLQLPPAFSSPPTFQPDPANTGTPVTFSSGPADGVTGNLQIRWSFGDGTSDSGQTVRHTFSEPGRYLVRVTATDSTGQTASSEVSVAVQLAQPLTVRTLNLQAMRASGGSDTLRLTAALDWPAGLEPEGLILSLDVGGASEPFVLDGSGRGQGERGSIAVQGSRKSPRAGQTVLIRAKLRGGDWAPCWLDDGLLDADLKGVRVELPVRVLLGDHCYATTALVRYSARRGISGNAKYTSPE